jgi:hypothetical protein
MQIPNQIYSIKKLGPHIVLVYNDHPMTDPETLATNFLQNRDDVGEKTDS